MHRGRSMLVFSGVWRDVCWAYWRLHTCTNRLLFKEPFSVSTVIRYCFERRDACLCMPKTIRNVLASFDWDRSSHARALLSNFVLCGKLKHRLIRILFCVEKSNIGWSEFCFVWKIPTQVDPNFVLCGELQHRLQFCFVWKIPTQVDPNFVLCGKLQPRLIRIFFVCVENCNIGWSEFFFVCGKLQHRLIRILFCQDNCNIAWSEFFSFCIKKSNRGWSAFCFVWKIAT